ncbi:uncharacterized protein LOC126161558 [Schistocerca cancellata]|uniref:uncharacterized protein LOC126161558 n=1 Tax=Schistocerca cancellata TaxID=274614 RepID=UPI002119699B|nr:uncharacterized protein LOC126161558 [Schistocerca cancellata]
MVPPPVFDGTSELLSTDVPQAAESDNQTASSSPLSKYATPRSCISQSESDETPTPSTALQTPEETSPEDEKNVIINSRSPKKSQERDCPESSPLLAHDTKSHTPPPAWSPPQTSPLTSSEEKNGSVVVTENPAYGLGNGGVKFEEGTKEPDSDDDRDSICSSSHSSKEEPAKPKIPDGGWGWVVVASSLVISMIADGISFSFGLLYIEFLKHFGESKSKTAWIGSLFMAVPLLSGPIGSALVDRYGCRWMTITGGLVSGLGFTLSAFCNTIEMMYLTFGVIAGLGLGLCYVTAVVSIAYWFDKKRTLATGLGACGTGAGTFVYAPMTTYFIETYGWRGTTLLLAGTFFNMCVCGAVMRDPEWWTLEQQKQSALSKSARTSSSCGSISARSEANDFPGVEEIRKLLKSGQTPEYILTTLATYITSDGPELETGTKDKSEDGLKTPVYSSVVNLPTFVRQSETVPLEVLESLSANKRIFNVILENYPSLLTCRSISDKGLNLLPAQDMVAPDARVPVTMSMRIKRQKKEKEAPHVESQDPSAAPLINSAAASHAVVVKTQSNPVPAIRDTQQNFKKQICTAPTAPHTNYLRGIRVHRNSVMYRGATLNINKYRLRASSCPDIYRNSMTTIAKETEEKWYSDILEMMKVMGDFSMFLEWHFFLMSWSTIILFTWFIVPYFYLADYVRIYNYSESESSSLLSIIGVTNCAGMIILGWAGDQPWMNVQKSYSVCLFLCGTVTMLMPLVIQYYWPVAILSALFGWFFASMFSFTPVIVVQLIPLERFTPAYGLILLCQGIGNLIGPPIAGGLFDITGVWDYSFYMAGVWIIFSGALIALIPMTKNRVMCCGGVLSMERDRGDSVSMA